MKPGGQEWRGAGYIVSQMLLTQRSKNKLEIKLLNTIPPLTSIGHPYLWTVCFLRGPRYKFLDRDPESVRWDNLIIRIFSVIDDPALRNSGHEVLLCHCPTGSGHTYMGVLPESSCGYHTYHPCAWCGCLSEIWQKNAPMPILLPPTCPQHADSWHPLPWASWSTHCEASWVTFLGLLAFGVLSIHHQLKEIHSVLEAEREMGVRFETGSPPF